jgi:hypothetical protein
MSLLMEVTELLSAESGAAAADSGDFDMSAGFGVWHLRYPVENFFVVAPEIFGDIGVRRIGDDEIDLKSCKERICKQILQN